MKIFNSTFNAARMAETSTSDEEGDDANIAANNASTSSLLRYNHQSSRIPYRAVRYGRLLNAYCHDSDSLIDSFSVPNFKSYPLYDSKILNTSWTGEEKEKFFTALARCGKGNLTEISRRVGKSLAEITAYVGLLDEATEWMKSNKRHRVYDLRKAPAAVEVDDLWLEFEERMARNMNRREKGEVAEEDTLLNVEKANELAGWYQNMLAPSKTPAVLSSTAADELNTVITTLTRRLLRTISFIVLSRARNAQSPMVTVSDVRTAVDLLSLPRHFSAHFSTLPTRMHRMGVKIMGCKDNYYQRFGMRGGEKCFDPLTVEAVLTARSSHRRRVDTRDRWPEEWNPNRGFKWETQSNEVEESFSESEEMDTPIPEDFWTMSVSPPPKSLNEDITDEENELLNAETSYLDAYDAEYSHIEMERLSQYIKHGNSLAGKTYKEAMKTFPTTKATEWNKVRKRFIAKHGYDWALYNQEIAGMDGTVYETPQEWELFQKRNPKRKNLEDDGPRKRPNTGSNSTSDSESVDYSDLDSDI